MILFPVREMEDRSLYSAMLLLEWLTLVIAQVWLQCTGWYTALLGLASWLRNNLDLGLETFHLHSFQASFTYFLSNFNTTVFLITCCCYNTINAHASVDAERPTASNPSLVLMLASVDFDCLLPSLILL